MVNLTWLNIDFVRVLELASEIGRVAIALDFRSPPPTYTFRGLEPVYRQTIQHYQRRCDQKYQEINHDTTEIKDGEIDVDALEVERKRFDELEDLLSKHARLVNGLRSMMENPHLHPRKHSDVFDKSPDPLAYLGNERYIDPPMKGYGFSNDFIRHWLAAIPGRVGRHFENEEAGSVHLTSIVQQIVIAFSGGAALLTPMIIMTFVTAIHWRLIIVSIATVVFGTAFAIVSSSKESVLAGTAAYAAVMVVYIGSASPSSSA